AGVYYFLRFNFLSTWAIIRAHVSFYKRFKSMMAKRTNKIQSAHYYHTNNIILTYFLHKKLNFRDLNEE
ncbi:glycosyltransferase family 2 protein, partial [Flavobacteriaceae bacterium]|nr:glycosyltransferase family 2 protein [Flavobacteriaceae bacterium]